MTDRRILPAVCVAAACAIGFLWATEVPLGVVGPPYEWAWERIRFLEDQIADAAWGAFIAAAIGICYLLLAALGARRLETASRSKVLLRLLMLVAAGFFWLLAVQESPPSSYGLAKVPRVIYYKGPSGYYFEARYKMGDVPTYLANYQLRISDPNDPDRVLHVGTHPPGLFLAHRGLIELCERSPTLSRWLRTIQPASAEAALDEIATNAHGTLTPLASVDWAAIWLTAIVTQLLGVAAIVPLYVLLRRYVSRTAAWRAVAFWPLVASLAVFFPTSDTVLPFFATTFLALWLIGRARRSLVLCLLSGVVFFAGMFVSLAVLPYALLAAVLTVWEIWQCDPPPVKAHVSAGLISVAWSLVGFFVPVVAMAVAFDLNVPRVWLTNFHNHADFYTLETQFPRTYWKWLIANPIELAIAVGLPLAVLAILSAVKTLRSGRAGNLRLLGMTVGCAAVWAFLWLSGKNMGEAARLWIVIQPWAILIAAPGLDNGTSDAIPANTRSRSLSMAGWLIVLGIQMIACLATVMRVTGFNFTGG